MASHDPIALWLPLVGSTLFIVLIVLLSTIPFPLCVLLPVLLAIVFVMHVQVFHTRSLAKAFWISTYLRRDSPIRAFLATSSLLRCLAIAISVPLAAVTYIAVFSYDLWDCLAVSMAIYAARLAHSSVSAPLDANLAEHLVELAHIRVYYWFAILLVLTALAAASIGKGFTSDYSSFTGDQLATEVITTVKHPVRIVQHCSRTLRYSELQLLRVRDIIRVHDINGGLYGWLIYLFFLVPNALPAFGLVTLYSGFERLLHQTISPFLRRQVLVPIVQWLRQ